MTLDEVIDQARRLAEHDKSLAYHYLMAILTGDGGKDHPNG